MAFYPYVTPTAQSRAVTEAFLGYQHRERISDGAFYDMTNLTGERYPLLSVRRRRGTLTQGVTPTGGIIAKDALCWIDGSSVFINGAEVELGLSQPVIDSQETAPGIPAIGQYWYKPSTGITRKYIGGGDDGWVETTYPKKQLVSMGAYLCIFPDKKYVNTADITDKGSMEHRSEIASGSVVYTLSAVNGETISPTVSSDPPEDPANGDYWVDTSGAFDVLNRFSAASQEWAQVPTTYVKITASGIGAGFEVSDVVTLSGLTGGSGRIQEQIEALNGSQQILARDDGWIVVTGIIEQSTTQTVSGTPVAAARTVPDMDFVCEAGNRLWGCYYGPKGGETVNEIYCCALGDFKNWNRYEGLSTDSWAASCGTDGQWTGAVNYFGSPTFFKEEHIHVVTLSATGAHSITDYAFEGVQKGSWESLTVVGSTLFYKSRAHVCAYQGGMPAVISDDLGETRYGEASGGAYGDLYYLSMRSGEGWSLFVYDSGRGTWHREDGLQGLMFAAADDDLYCLTPAGEILALRGTQGEPEDETEIPWSATTGLLTLEMPDQKVVTRYDIRVSVHGPSTLKLEIRYDSEGAWTDYGTVSFDGALTRNRTFPVRPRRCDHLQMRLGGTGDVRIVSVARIIEQGSDYNR